MGAVAEKLGLREFARSDFIALLDHILQEVPVRRLIAGCAVPAPPPRECVEVYPEFVFDIPLSGVKHLMYGTGKEICETCLQRGEVLFSPPGVWKLPLWDLPHELFCLIYSAGFLRCTYVDYSKPDGKGMRPPCIHFHHTDAAPTPILNELLRLLTRIRGEETGADLTRALFRLTRDFLAADTPVKIGKAERNFLEIKQYLSENFSLPLTRAETARHFHLNPGYLSRLFRHCAQDSFSGVLRGIRMEHAAFLLEKTDLLIDEITIQCGYQSTPFFTSAFHRHFGLPPGQFRLKNRGKCSES